MPALDFKQLLRTRRKLFDKAADWAKGGNAFGWDFPTLFACRPELYNSIRDNTNAIVDFLQEACTSMPPDDIGSGKYDYLGIAERVPLHAAKAYEFFLQGDLYNAQQHAKKCISLCAQGYMGTEPYKKAVGIDSWIVNAPWPGRLRVHECSIATKPDPDYWIKRANAIK